VFGLRADGPFNVNQHWCGRDDTTELFFRDWDHIQSVFKSEYVKTKVGPDEPLFVDFETSMVLTAHEKPLSLKTRLQAEKSSASLENGDATVAMFFISTPDNVCEGEQLERVITPALTKALEENAQEDVWGLQVNIDVESTQFDLNSYFGGLNMP
jgi:EthD domain